MKILLLALILLHSECLAKNYDVDIINKKYWIKSNKTPDIYKNCEDVKIQAKFGQFFTVESVTEKKGKDGLYANMIFDNGDKACIRMFEIDTEHSYWLSDIDTELLYSKTNNLIKKTGVKKGNIYWLKYPYIGINGLSKLTVIDIIVKEDSFIVVFDKFELNITDIDTLKQIVYNKYPSKEFTKKELNLISKSNINIGMSNKAVIASWGVPDRVNKTVGKWGVHEQWIYGDYSVTYLYFENNKLTSWQGSE